MGEIKAGLKLLDELQAAFTDHYLKVCACIHSTRCSLLNQQQTDKQPEPPLTYPTQKTDFSFDIYGSAPEQPTSSKPKTDFSLDVYETTPKSSNFSELIQKKLEAFRTLPAFASSQNAKNGVKPKFRLRFKRPKASVQANTHIDKPTDLDNNSELNAQAEISSLPSFNQAILDMFGSSEAITSLHTDVSTSPIEQQSSPSGSSELPTFSSFNDFSSFSLFSDPSVFSSSANQSVTDSLPVNDASPLIKEKQIEKIKVTDGYKCSVCNKVFKSYQYLTQNHMNLHNGNRYKCSYCSYTSAYYSNKYVHEKVCAKKPKKVD